MAEFSISYGELESRPVFNITAKCGHSFREYRRPELAIERWLGAYGELERCPDCVEKDFQDLLDQADYQLNPDTRALRLERIDGVISIEWTRIPTVEDSEGEGGGSGGKDDPAS